MILTIPEIVKRATGPDGTVDLTKIAIYGSAKTMLPIKEIFDYIKSNKLTVIFWCENEFDERHW